MGNTIAWFRRDLRLADNHTWTAAVDAARGDGSSVVALFVLDDALWGPSGDNRRWFLAGCLAELDAELDGRLVVRRGDPAEVVADVAGEHGAATVFHAQDVGVYGRRRDEAVARALAAAGRELVEADTPYVAPAGTLRTGSGDAYKVYTPYLRAWRQRRLPRAVERPADAPVAAGIPSDGIPAAPDVTAELPEPGEAAGQRALDDFLGGSGVADYAGGRDAPSVDATSRLSPYLKYGCVHPRQIMRLLDGRDASHATFAKELAWRDFYADVLHEWPASAWSAWNPAMADMAIDDGPQADERFAAWCAGRTGFPIVDAGMRQLAAIGWMHNRVRMITASFLVKDLHIDWVRGARFFLHHLVDGDLPSNNHGWQWVAGTGTDAAPYFRIFNPTTQSLKFDREGDYIRRWVPELADVPGAAVHDPSSLAEPPAGYLPPIVDHAAERAESLRRYAALRAR